MSPLGADEPWRIVAQELTEATQGIEGGSPGANEKLVRVAFQHLPCSKCGQVFRVGDGLQKGSGALHDDLLFQVECPHCKKLLLKIRFEANHSRMALVDKWNDLNKRIAKCMQTVVDGYVSGFTTSTAGAMSEMHTLVQQRMPCHECEKEFFVQDGVALGEPNCFLKITCPNCKRVLLRIDS